MKHRCSCHGLPLAGGPVLWWCPETGSNVPDADLDHEFRPAVTR